MSWISSGLNSWISESAGSWGDGSTSVVITADPFVLAVAITADATVGPPGELITADPFLLNASLTANASEILTPIVIGEKSVDVCEESLWDSNEYSGFEWDEVHSRFNVTTTRPDGPLLYSVEGQQTATARSDKIKLTLNPNGGDGSILLKAYDEVAEAYLTVASFEVSGTNEITVEAELSWAPTINSQVMLFIPGPSSAILSGGYISGIEYITLETRFRSSLGLTGNVVDPVAHIEVEPFHLQSSLSGSFVYVLMEGIVDTDPFQATVGLNAEYAAYIFSSLSQVSSNTGMVITNEPPSGSLSLSDPTDDFSFYGGNELSMEDDLDTISFVGTLGIAGTLHLYDSLDTWASAPGGNLELADKTDTLSFTAIVEVMGSLSLSDENEETLSIQAQPGSLAILGFFDEEDEFAFTGHGVTQATLSLSDSLESVTLFGLTGTVAILSLSDVLDSLSLAGISNLQATLELDDETDFVSMEAYATAPTSRIIQYRKEYF